MKLKTTLYIILLLAVFVFCTPAHAANRFSLIEVHPDPIQNRYFFIHGSDTMRKYAWSLGTFTLYYNKLLDIDWRITNISRRGTVTTDERVGGMEHLFFQYFYGAFGITDRVSIMFDMPLFWSYKFGFATTADPSNQWYYVSPGDVRFSGKVNALRIEDYPVGLSFIGSVSAPTGKDAHFLGDEGVTGEIGLIAETKPVKKFHLAFNASFQTREKVDINDISFRDYLKFGLGANYKVHPNVGIIAELEAHTAANNFFGEKRTSPTEARLGARWFPGGGNWMLGAGASMGIIYGKGMPRYAGFINVGYSSDRKKISKFKRAIMLGDYPYCIVYFNFDKANLTKENETVLEDFVDGLSKFDKDIKEMTIEVRGWTDPTGPRRYNKLLSKKRAQAVADYMEDAFRRRKINISIRAFGMGERSWVPKREGRRADAVTIEPKFK